MSSIILCLAVYLASFGVIGGLFSISKYETPASMSLKTLFRCGTPIEVKASLSLLAISRFVPSRIPIETPYSALRPVFFLSVVQPAPRNAASKSSAKSELSISNVSETITTLPGEAVRSLDSDSFWVPVKRRCETAFSNSSLSRRSVSNCLPASIFPLSSSRIFSAWRLLTMRPAAICPNSAATAMAPASIDTVSQSRSALSADEKGFIVFSLICIAFVLIAAIISVWTLVHFSKPPL